jgi:PAS domain S-box-containing protein
MESDSEMPKTTLPKQTIQSSASLRKKAEERLIKQASIKGAHSISPRVNDNRNESENLGLLHELEILKVELEIQNEELKLAVDRAAAATALYNFSPTAYFTIERDGTICQLNHSGALLLNKNTNQLINSNLRLFITQDSLPVMNDFLKKIFESKSKQFCEVSLGLNQNVDIHIYLEGIISEDLQKCFITAVDISERKKAERKLIESEAKYRSLVDEVNDGYYISDELGIFTFANRALNKMLGYEPPDTIVGRNFMEFIPLAKINDIISQYQAAMVSGKDTEVFTTEVVKKNGTSVFFEIKPQVIISEGKSAGSWGMIRDITERQKAEAAIQESEERYRKLVELSPFGIAIYQESEFVYVNRAGLTLLGSSNPQDLIGKPVTSIVHPDSLPEVMRRMGLVANGNTVPPMEEKLIRIDGSIFIAEVIALSTAYNGKPAGQVIVRDITEQKKAEDSLKLNEIRLNELNSSKDKFFSIIAHDLKGHFNSIIGFSSLLSANMKEKDYDGVEKYANIIQKSSERAMDLLMNLMDWAQSQTGRMEFIPEVIDSTELIDEVVDFFNDAAQQKSITISRKNNDTVTFFADKPMVSTILRNLVSNALKYTLPGGKIVISTKQKNNELMVTVKDNGIGIKSNAIEKLFTIEESYSTIGTNNEVGTGFGLILCKEFVEKHNGKIWVKSEIGKGSKFCFTIPNTKQFNQSACVS